MKIFISQPMQGLPQEEIDSLREEILSWADSAYDDFTPIPIFSEFQLSGKSPVEGLSLSLHMLSDADLVIFAPEWNKHRGCVIEHAVCTMYEIPYVELLRLSDGKLVKGFR